MHCRSVHCGIQLTFETVLVRKDSEGKIIRVECGRCGEVLNKKLEQTEGIVKQKSLSPLTEDAFLDLVKELHKLID